MNILGIDFEEWFHPQLIQNIVKNEQKSFRVVRGIDKILNFLSKHDTFATFFVVGEIIQRYPEILDKIISNGHEIACHSMNHSRLDSLNSQQFSYELLEFAKLTENRSKGFRAPTFSLNDKSSWAIDVLEKFHYLYDSSIVPAKSSLYGNPNASVEPYKISSKSLYGNDENGKIIEFPLMVTKLFGKRFPAGGGFFLRTLPFSITKKAIKEYEKMKIPSTFYIHSWELTPEHMPRIKLPRKAGFVTYHNLESVMNRMDELLSHFQFTSFERYIQKNI